MSGEKILTVDQVNEITGDDIAFWLGNPFLTPDMLIAKVCWWMTQAAAPVPSEVAETTAGEREARQVVISPVEWADLLAEAWRKGHRLHEPVIEFGETPCDCPNPYGGSSA